MATTITTPFLDQQAAEENAALAGNAAGLEASRLASQPGYAEREFVRTKQQGFVDNVVDAFKGIALYKVGRYTSDEHVALQGYLEKQGYGVAAAPLSWIAAIAGSTLDDKNYDKAANVKALTEGVPVEHWDSVMAYDSLQEAQMARARIIADTNREQTLASQKSSTSTLATIAGGFLDVDLPLTVLSGGYWGAAKVAATTFKTSRYIGMSVKTAQRAVNIVDGIAAGAQAGAMVAAAEYSVDDRANVDTFVRSVLTGATTGGALGVFMTHAGKKVVNDLKAIQDRNIVERPMTEVDTELDARLDEGWIDVDGSLSAEHQLAYDTLEVPGPQPAQSIGAAVVPYTSGLKSPTENMLPEHRVFLQRASDWMDRSGARQELQDLDNTVFGKLMTGHFSAKAGLMGSAINGAEKVATRFVNSMGNDVMGLYRSKSNGANWFAMNVLESPSTYGRGQVSASAAALDATAERLLASHTLRMPMVAWDWAKANGKTQRMLGRGTGVGISKDGAKALYREVVLNFNDIKMGRAPRSAGNRHVDEIVGMVQREMEDSLNWLKGYGKSTAVKGTENLMPDPGYIPQRANGKAMYDAVMQGRTTRENIEAAFATGYAASGAPQDIAEILAKANVGRAIAREGDVDTSLIDLLQEDGRIFLRERLENQGLPQGEIDTIMDKLTGLQAMAGQPGFTKHRNDLDMDIPVTMLDGSSMLLVDFIDHDLPNMLQRYRKGVSGAGALAKKGIRSRKDRDTIIGAIQAEQRALGEDAIPTDKLKAMLSDFDAGPSHGYYDGKTNKGISAPISVGKAVANLSLLGNLGFAQMIDSANAIAADGLANWWRHSTAGKRLGDELGRINSQVKDDLIVLQGTIGQDQHMYREHVHLDEIAERDAGAFLQGLRKVTGNMQFVQGYTSMFNAVRGHQQVLGALVLTNKVLRSIRDKTNGERIKYDFGIDEGMQDELRDLMDSGIIEFEDVVGKGGSTHNYVSRLNPEQWGQQLRHNFGAVMVRAQDTNTMRAMAGETDVWARTEWGTILSHLKMFPLLAIPKQMMRNGRFMDAQTMGSLMYGMAAAYMVMKVRDAVTGKERTEAQQAMNAVGYSSMMGWLPMVWDPAMTMLGMDDYRMQRYGRQYEAQIPALEVANKMMRIPGAVGNLLGGNHLNGDDKQALLAIPFMRTLGIGEWAIDSINPDKK